MSVIRVGVHSSRNMKAIRNVKVVIKIDIIAWIRIQIPNHRSLNPMILCGKDEGRSQRQN